MVFYSKLNLLLSLAQISVQFVQIDGVNQQACSNSTVFVKKKTIY